MKMYTFIFLLLIVVAALVIIFRPKPKMTVPPNARG